MGSSNCRCVTAVLGGLQLWKVYVTAVADGDLSGYLDSYTCDWWVTAGAGGFQLLAGGDLRGCKDSYSCARWITAGAGELRLVRWVTAVAFRWRLVQVDYD